MTTPQDLKNSIQATIKSLEEACSAFGPAQRSLEMAISHLGTVTQGTDRQEPGRAMAQLDAALLKLREGESGADSAIHYARTYEQGV